jgi:hypothetical protein
MTIFIRGIIIVILNHPEKPAFEYIFQNGKTVSTIGIIDMMAMMMSSGIPIPNISISLRSFFNS